jgi:hypothetical protein
MKKSKVGSCGDETSPAGFPRPSSSAKALELSRPKARPRDPELMVVPCGSLALACRCLHFPICWACLAKRPILPSNCCRWRWPLPSLFGRPVEHPRCRQRGQKVQGDRLEYSDATCSRSVVWTFAAFLAGNVPVWSRCWRVPGSTVNFARCIPEKAGYRPHSFNQSCSTQIALGPSFIIRYIFSALPKPWHNRNRTTPFLGLCSCPRMPQTARLYPRDYIHPPLGQLPWAESSPKIALPDCYETFSCNTITPLANLRQTSRRLSRRQGDWRNLVQPGAP